MLSLKVMNRSCIKIPKMGELKKFTSTGIYLFVKVIQNKVYSGDKTWGMTQKFKVNLYEIFVGS